MTDKRRKVGRPRGPLPLPMPTYRRAPPPGARYISAPQLLDRYGGRSHMWLVRKLADDPKFPKPVYHGRLRFFDVAELEAYERQCAMERTAEAV
jgi:hypothetical protein